MTDWIGQVSLCLSDGGYELVQLGELELNAVRSGDVAAA